MKRILGLVLVLGLPALAATFRAGAAKVDITPREPQWLMGYNARQSTGTHDQIYHRVIAMDDGTTPFYLIASDLCLFSPGVYIEATERLRKEIGVGPENIWWSVNHSHATPEVGPPGIYKTLLGRSDHEYDRPYTTLVIEALVQGVKEAKAKLAPARLALGTGISFANINRRARDMDGSISLGLNPDGPTDRQIGLIRVEGIDGAPIAVVANYAMHGTVMSGANLEVSGDAPGIVAAYVEQKINAPVLYVNGAAGNLAPIYSGYSNPKAGHLTQFNVLLGDRILEALNGMGSASPEVTLRVGEKIVETPRKDGLEWPTELTGYLNNSGKAPLVRLPVRFLQINDTIIWSAPIEMFCEIATAVRDRSPFTHTFYFGYTNGWIGYLPTKAGFEEGGYEPRASVFTGAAEKDVREAVVKHIQSLHAGK